MTALAQAANFDSTTESRGRGTVDELLTVREAASFLKSSVRTVERKVASGELGSVKIGYLRRIPRRSLLGLIQHQDLDGQVVDIREAAPKDGFS
jgi:excisionase family DNA binding protein